MKRVNWISSKLSHRRKLILRKNRLGSLVTCENKLIMDNDIKYINSLGFQVKYTCIGFSKTSWYIQWNKNSKY